MPTSTIAVLAKRASPRSPDWSSAIHDPECFIVKEHQGGAWEFVNQRRGWVLRPADQVPTGAKRCRFCGGGR
jgi:hypothetical protein